MTDEPNRAERMLACDLTDPPQTAARIFLTDLTPLAKLEAGVASENFQHALEAVSERPAVRLGSSMGRPDELAFPIEVKASRQCFEQVDSEELRPVLRLGMGVKL